MNNYNNSFQRDSKENINTSKNPGSLLPGHSPAIKPAVKKIEFLELSAKSEIKMKVIPSAGTSGTSIFYLVNQEGDIIKAIKHKLSTDVLKIDMSDLTPGSYNLISHS